MASCGMVALSSVIACVRIFFERWRRWAKAFKLEVYVLYFAYRDPRTPWYAKILVGLVVAYALSPIDLIPDPIPVLGLLDDLLLLPIGVLFARKLLPSQVLEDCRKKAIENTAEKPTSWAAAAAIVAIWLAVIALLGWLFVRWRSR